MERYNGLKSLVSVSGQSNATNPERGCGKLKEGGYYLRQHSAIGGSLAWLTFTWGTHVAGQPNIFAPMTEERGVSFFNPAASFMLGSAVPRNFPVNFDDAAQRATYTQLVQRVGNVGILDFVGATHYTPWQFIEEAWVHGISRRVNRNLALHVATQLPIPIFFCHPLPCFDSEAHRDQFDPTGTLSPVWQNENWGLFSSDGYCGDDHYMLPLVKSLPKKGYNGVLAEVAIFAASWITGVGKAVHSADEVDDPGIMPILLEVENAN